MQAPIPRFKSGTAANALVGIWTLALTAFIVAALYLARDLLVPLALAALLTFLLAPLVTRLERWLGRIGAVLLVATLIFASAGAAGWVVARQFIDFAAKLPNYQENIQVKLRPLTSTIGRTFTKFSGAMEDLQPRLPAGTPPVVTDAPNTGNKAAPPSLPPAPVSSVPAVEKANPFRIMRAIFAPLLGPLGTAALVVILVIFMLLEREDLRNRLIRLIGRGRISSTTHAMNDAGARISRYLLMQLIVNVTYGIPVAIGLYFIGVPNAVLWGASAAVLRFIPYVGPWIGASIPIAVAFAVSPGWLMPLLALGLFITLELLSNNVLEPWLYSSSTGVSPIAIVLAAIFWSWLWGPIGLVLATPMTVCLVVMGRHIPRLSFLSVILSDEKALSPAQDCYYRLLTIGEHDEIELVEDYLKANSLTSLYDSVFIPVITAIEIDLRLELLDDGQHDLVQQSLRDLIDDLGAHPPALVKAATDPAAPTEATAPACHVYCLPARADRDALAGMMLAQLLTQQGMDAQSAPTGLGISEIVSLIENAGADVICISVVAPSTVLHARYLCLKLRALLPKHRILVGLWGGSENFAAATRRLLDSGANAVVDTLEAAAAAVTPAPLPPAEERPAAA